MSDPSITSPSKRLNMASATLNINLEEAFQVTVRPSQTGTYTYLGEDYGDALNSSNISAVIFEKISQNSTELSSAVAYLYSAYRRILSKETTIMQSCLDEFLKYGFLSLFPCLFVFDHVVLLCLKNFSQLQDANGVFRCFMPYG